MNKCGYCGKEYPDEVTVCPIDDEPLGPRGLQSALPPGQGHVPASQPDSTEAYRAAADRNMLVGGLWCVGGIVVTWVTYSAASSGGGSYVVAWGAIIFGALRFFRGLLAKGRL
jgi:hypothetical protein